MANAAYANPAQRIGKWKGEILSRAIPVECLQIAAVQKSMPKNVSNTVIYRRWVPYGATVTNTNGVLTGGDPNILVGPETTADETLASNTVATILGNNVVGTEGVAPTAETIVAQNVTAVLAQYACLYSFTDVVADLGEDDIEDALKTQVAERIALVRELELYSKVRAGTNIFYAGGVSALASVTTGLTAAFMRKIARGLASSHAKKITGILAPSANIGTKPIEAAYLVFCHTDLDATLRDSTVFPGYTPVAEYGSRKPMHEMEMGSFENFRFIASPELVPYANAGPVIGSTGLLSYDGVKINVYPIIVTGQEAYGSVALRGSNAFDLSVIPVGTKDKSDPLGQKGYVGAKFYAASVVLNQQWMAVGLCCALALT